MRVGLIQSNYIPWKGYFDIINDVDLFIFHDNLQYTKGDWRNRNLVKTSSGTEWLTIPVGTDEHRLIEDVPLPCGTWAIKHWRKLESVYGRAKFFAKYRPLLRDIYFSHKFERLSEFNQTMIERLSREALGIRTRFRNASEFQLTERKSARVLQLMQLAGATEYVSGPAAQGYMDVDAFERAGVSVIWWSYAGYPEYFQAHPPFDHRVTILDLLFQVGPDAPWYIWGWRRDASVVTKKAS